MEKKNTLDAPKFILAPLRGVTQLTFRRCLHEHFGGIDSAVSPFLTTVAGSRIKPTHLADIMPEANKELPLVPQIIGKNPAEFRTLLRAIKDLGYTRCDLNAGCPWPMIVKKNRGAGLMRDPDILRAMLDAGCDELPNGLSLKVRLGIDEPGLLLKRMPLLNSYPLTEITIHARTAKQRYEGEVDIDSFEECLNAAAMPVVYNGDIKTEECFEKLSARFPQVSRWMIGRGLITDPSLAYRLKGSTIDNTNARMAAFVADYGERTRAELFGPASFLGRMKEFWSYHHALYKDGETLWRKLRVCSKYDEYDALMRIPRTIANHTGIDS